MATLNENIDRIENAKTAIKNAIIGKGVAVDDTALLDTYASKINEIPTGGAAPVLETLTVFDNGIYLPKGEVDGFNKVDVQIPQQALQEKVKLDITSNGTTVIDPSEGYDAIKGATVNVNVPELNGFDWTGTGLDNERMNDRVQNDINYTKEKYSSFDATATDVSQKFANDTKLVYAPNVDFSKATVANQVFANDINLKYIPDYTFGRLTECKGLFEGCKSLKEVSYLTFTSDVCGMEGLFKNCNSLERIGTLSFNGSYSTADMFKGCVNLVDFRGISNLLADLDLGDCAKLSFESVRAILNGLPDLTKPGSEVKPTRKIVLNTKVIPPIHYIEEVNKKGWKIYNELGVECKVSQ